MRSLKLTVAAAACVLMAFPATTLAQRRAERVPGAYIVAFKSSVASASRETAERERRQGFDSEFVYRRALEGFAAELSPGQVRRLRADREVAYVVQQRRVHALADIVSGDSAPTGVRRFEAATTTTARGASGVNVAVIDTGIDLSHSDLNAVHGINAVSNPDKSCTPQTQAQDDDGHGTHVAGSIGALNNGSGVVGAAPGTKLYAAKVLDCTGSGTDADVIKGIDWATSTRTDADTTNDIAVANMSLGGLGSPIESCSSTTDAMHKAVCNGTARGITFVVAAGNDGWDFDYPSTPDTPAAYPEALTVSAVSDSDGAAGGSGGAPTCRSGETDDRYASFSNYALTTTGKSHTIAGPGVCIKSTWLGGGYGTISGTSMATPHVAGAVALCLDEAGTAGPCAGKTPAEIIQKMRTDAQGRSQAGAFGFAGDPDSPAGSRYFGYLAYAGAAPAPAPPPPAQTAVYNPAGYTYTGSIYNSTGTLSRLFNNDSSRVEINAVAGGGTYTSEIRPHATIAASQLTSLRKLTVDWDANASDKAAALSLRVFNLTTGQWQTVDGPRTGVTSDRAVRWSTASPRDYVSSTGKVLASVHATQSRSFRTRTDMVRFTIDY